MLFRVEGMRGNVRLIARWTSGYCVTPRCRTVDGLHHLVLPVVQTVTDVGPAHALSVCGVGNEADLKGSHV